jgi:hypothetical protein
MNIHVDTDLWEPVRAHKFQAWLRQAARGEWFEYHRGLLAPDRAAGVSRHPVPVQMALNELADLVFSAAATGRVCLVQRRVGPHTFAYYAVSRG